MNKEAYFGAYIGQKVQYKFNGKILDRELTPYFLMELFESPNCNEFSDHKLILRPISAMTEEEVKKVRDILGYIDSQPALECVELFLNGNDEAELDIYKVVEICEYLISKGIDIFNLREKGFAIYE